MNILWFRCRKASHELQAITTINYNSRLSIPLIILQS
jgi:hypothetical protein